MKKLISELLYPINSNSKYTEEYAYNNSGDYIVIDGSTQGFEYKLKIDTYDYCGTVIAVTTVGYYAGHVSYYNGKFSVGNNVSCYMLTEDARKMNIDIRYIVFKLFHISKSIISGEAGGYAALNTTKFENSYIEIDSIEKQNKIIEFMKAREVLSNLELKLEEKTKLINNLQLSNLEGKKHPINEILDVCGGSSFLTEEFLYNNSDNLEERIPVYTGAVDFTGKYVNKNKARNIFNNCIKITRKGQAGAMSYISGEFTINDDAYVIKIKEKYKKEINVFFLQLYLSTIISKAVSAEDGNGTFNKTKFKEMEIILPKIDVQNKIGALYCTYIKLYKIFNETNRLRIEINKNICDFIY